MKTKFLKGILSAILLLCISTSFALNDPGNPEGNEDTPTSANINAFLPLLMIGAMAIGGFVFLNKNKKEQVAN